MDSSARGRARPARRRWPAGDLAVAVFAVVTVALALWLAVSHASPAVARASAASAGSGHVASGARPPSRTLCARHPGRHDGGNATPGAYVGGTRYWVQDDRFGTDAPLCLALTPHGRAAFRVSVSRAADPGATAVAYPFIQYGCYWGWCTPGSALPLRVGAIGSATSTWYTRQGARGVWNASYDLWLNSTRLARHHADRAEVMIWLNATTRGYRTGGPGGGQAATIAGRRYYIRHWHTGGRIRPGGWEYVQYRLAGRPQRVRDLDLRAVLLDAARRHLISRSWYLQGILAGNEIWRGGQGLATTRFSARVTRR